MPLLSVSQYLIKQIRVGSCDMTPASRTVRLPYIPRKWTARFWNAFCRRGVAAHYYSVWEAILTSESICVNNWTVCDQAATVHALIVEPPVRNIEHAAAVRRIRSVHYSRCPRLVHGSQNEHTDKESPTRLVGVLNQGERPVLVVLLQLRGPRKRHLDASVIGEDCAMI